MKSVLKYYWLLFLLFTKVSFGQDTVALNSKTWLSIINNNAIAKPEINKRFNNASAGYALYFSKVDTLSVPYLGYVGDYHSPFVWFINCDILSNIY
ncbi:MAG: hypothetical protein M3015_04095 [Bacteroidota bacterium]|nr:hypothetical protein [Bacteroidota bacterium]